MDLDEPDLSESMIGESTETFIDRIKLAKRVLPILRDLVCRNFSLVVESERRSSSAASLTSDFVLEYGDVRVRIILTPSESAPFEANVIDATMLAHYMLDVPDTDAVAIVADDRELSTWIFDIYSLNASATIEMQELATALNSYFEDFVHPIEVPNFRSALSLPTQDQLEPLLQQQAIAALEHIKTARVSIDEKKTALGRIGLQDRERLIKTLMQTIRTGHAAISILLDEDQDLHD
jgi:hypothetical protein